MNETDKKIVGALAGFILGCLVLGLIFILIQVAIEMFDLGRVRFRFPVALLVLPIIGATIGYQIAPEAIAIANDLYRNSDVITRLVVAVPVFWVSVVLAYVFMFEPFGSRISESEWVFLFKIMVFPTAVLWAGAWVVWKGILRR